MMLDTVECGDCAELLGRLPGDCIDLIVTSPPYGAIRTAYEFKFDFQTIGKQLFRVTKQGGVVVWVVGDETKNGSESGTSFRQALHFMSLGFNLHDTMIYHRSSPPLTHNRYEQHFEYMFVLSKEKPKTFNPMKAKKDYHDKRKSRAGRREADGSYDIMFSGRQDDKIIGNVWNISSGGGISTADHFSYQHPAIFPEALARDHILSWSNPDDVILDPMSGSGTTLKIAKELGRHWIGIDISADYCAMSQRRVDGARVPLPGLV